MSVTIRPFRTGGWEVDIRVVLPDGSRHRERRKAPTSSKSAAKRWGEARERELLLNGLPKPRKEVPKLEDFAPRWMEGYCKANRLKPSGIASKETILRVHLVPRLGRRKLDAITNEDVQRLKGKLADKAAKTVNNILTVLNTLLKTAVEWDVIEHMPCRIRMLKVTRKEAAFHDFDEYDRLVEAARKTDSQAHLIVLLGGDAGLRCGEIMALRWTDVDFDRRHVHVQRSDWKGHVTTPKGGRSRRVPLTKRLYATLRSHRHLAGPTVLCQDDGSPLTQKIVQNLVKAAARRANLEHGGLHVLRHTFCSHLAMRGAPARAIQELAGHRDLSTTQGYMHLSPAVAEAAIRLLEEPNPAQSRGEIVETGGVAEVK